MAEKNSLNPYSNGRYSMSTVTNDIRVNDVRS